MSFFHHCTALITGASSGFGAEFARQLAPHASTLVLVARRLERLEQLEKELVRPGLTIHTWKADLSDNAGVEEVIKRVEELDLPLNLLINNAGLGDHGRFEHSDGERIQEMLTVNVTALTRLTYRLLPRVKCQKNAAILNVSSVASFMPLPKMAVYAATKAYVTSFSEALRAELRKSGVRVTALCPGPVTTEFGKVAERKGKADPVPAPEIFKVPTEKVVRSALKAVSQDRARVIPGWFVAFVMLLTAAMPMFILRLAMKGQVK